MNGGTTLSPKKPAPPPASAPANLEKQTASTPSSAQKRSMLGGWLDALRPKPKGKEADLGGAMEAYYDKEKKRWIFPGDDPDAVDPTAGPPPTTAELKAKAPVEEKKQAPLDPLAAMMAPPPARGLRSAVPRKPAMPTGNGDRPGMPPTPPKFAVFTPPPKSD